MTKPKKPTDRELLEEIYSLTRKINRKDTWYWAVGKGILFALASTIGFVLLIIIFLRFAQYLGFIPFFGEYLRDTIVPILEEILNQRLPH